MAPTYELQSTNISQVMVSRRRARWLLNTSGRSSHLYMSPRLNRTIGLARLIYSRDMKESYLEATMDSYECGTRHRKCLPLLRELRRAATSHPYYLQNSYLLHNLLLQA